MSIGRIQKWSLIISLKWKVAQYAKTLSPFMLTSPHKLVASNTRMLEQVLFCESIWNLDSIWTRIGIFIVFTDLTIQSLELGVGVEVNNHQLMWEEERKGSMNGGREGEKGREG